MADYCSMADWSYDLPATPVDPNEILIGAGRLWLQSYCSESTVMQEVGIWTPDMGFTLTTEMEKELVYSDQYRLPMRSVVSQYSGIAKFELLQSTMQAHLFAFMSDAYATDGTNITTICLTGQHREDYWRGHLVCPYIQSCGIQHQREILLPKITLENLGDMVFKQREALKLAIDMRWMGDFDMSGYENVGISMAIRDRLYTP